WKAPVEDLDPWRPETLTAARLKILQGWTPTAKSPAGLTKELTAAQRKAAREEMARMLKATDAEAVAARERLARHGAALLPEVNALTRAVTTDLERERLTALRYRLVASGAL